MKTKELQEQLARLTSQIADARALGNPQAQADLQATADKLDDAKTEENRAAAISGAPASVKDTVDTAREEHVRALETHIAGLTTVIEDMSTRQIDTSKALAELTKAQNDLTKEQTRRMEFDMGGRAKGEFNADDHQRLIQSRSSNEQVRDLQKQHDAAYLLNQVRLYKQRNGNAEFMPGVRAIEDTRSFKRLDNMTRAMYTTGTNLGAELVTTSYSARIHEKYEAARRLASSFERINASGMGGSFVVPVITANPDVYIVGERANNDGSNIDASDLSTDNRTFTAKTVGARSRLSAEMNEDSLLASQGYIENGYVKALKGAEENAIINGDTTGTHMDSDVTASNDVQRLWDGIRDRALNGSSTTADLGTWADATMTGLVGTMGDYADEPSELVAVFGTNAFWKYAIASAAFRSAAELGQPGSLATGKLPNDMWYGMTAFASGKMKRDLNASGVYDGSTTTKTGVAVVRPDQYLMVDWRNIQLELDKDIESQQIVAVATMRLMFKKMAAAADKTEAFAYNVA